MLLRALAPEASASTNSAISAIIFLSEYACPALIRQLADSSARVYPYLPTGRS